MCVSGLPAWMCVVPFGLQRSASDSLGLGLQTVVSWMLEIKSGSPTKATSTLFFLTFIFIYYILITVSVLSIPPSLPPAPSHPVFPRSVSFRKREGLPGMSTP